MCQDTSDVFYDKVHLSTSGVASKQTLVNLVPLGTNLAECAHLPI